MLTVAEQRYGSEAVNTVLEWRDLINAASATDYDKVIMVNDFFNGRIRWRPDIEVYGQKDYWATPLETLGRKEGDCEDFSIAKYVTLILLGIDPKSLRMVYVRATMNTGAVIAHMVLAYYENPTATPLILDNINLAVLPANKRGDLNPVFSFNADGLWKGGQSQATDQNPMARISRWREMFERMESEGINQLINKGA